MPKKDETPASGKVAWVKKLPESGGAWGRGIVTTVDAMEEDLKPLLAQREELDRAVKARESILNDSVKRATREAKGLFNDSQIAKAKAERAGEVTQPKPSKGAGAPAAPT